MAQSDFLLLNSTQRKIQTSTCPDLSTCLTLENGIDKSENEQKQIIDANHNNRRISTRNKIFPSFKLHEKKSKIKKCQQSKQQNNKNETVHDTMSTILSGLYAKFLVVLGIALPITDILSLRAPRSFYQGFYLYLYLVSLLFVLGILGSHLKSQSMIAILVQYYKTKTTTKNNLPLVEKPIVRHGSFYLRIGAIAFGIGSMVYSGLEFLQYFELKKDYICQNIFLILNPIARICLIIVQILFIFLNGKDLRLHKYKSFVRFGLMHMIATNLCEWLSILVEETKHEIFHLMHHKLEASKLNSTLVIFQKNQKYDYTQNTIINCQNTNIMENLIQTVAPFLFPCTIEYSLISAVTILEMWKSIRPHEKRSLKKQISHNEKDAHLFSTDCARAHCGMFGGILITVLTIITLIIYFEFFDNPDFKNLGIFQITVTESIILTITIISLMIAMYQIRNLKLSNCHREPSLDCNLLVVAQSGVYIYSMFSIIGSYLTLDRYPYEIYGLICEILSLIQTSLQTLFVLNAWWRRCRSSNEIKQKPGRELVTFLLVTNISLWMINTFIKSSAIFRPIHLMFYGLWPWTIVTHISTPLAIFYRFHSTICLFEIWKNTYKVRNVI